MPIGGFQIQSTIQYSNSICTRKKNDVSDFQVFSIKMTGHTGLEKTSKKMINSLQGQSYRQKGRFVVAISRFFKLTPRVTLWTMRP